MLKVSIINPDRTPHWVWAQSSRYSEQCIADARFMIGPKFAVSIVIPVFNEEEALPNLFRELRRVRDEELKPHGPIEVILVDDGSKDKGWELIAAQCAGDRGYVGIK